MICGCPDHACGAFGVQQSSRDEFGVERYRCTLGPQPASVHLQGGWNPRLGRPKTSVGNTSAKTLLRHAFCESLRANSYLRSCTNLPQNLGLS